MREPSKPGVSPCGSEFADESSAEERADVLEQLGRDPGAWLQALRAISSVETALVYADALWRAWATGGLEQEVLTPPWDERPVRALHALLAQLFHALRNETTPPRWPAFDDRTLGRHPVVTEALTRRWCWIDGWTLMSQDEDLLFRENDATPMLEEALAGCPKRDYAVSIATRAIQRAVERPPRARREEFWHRASAWPPLLDRVGPEGEALARTVRRGLAAKAR